MDVQIFALCDAATAHAGKIFMLGVFDQVFAANAPIAAPPCSLAVRIRFERMEEGNKALRIQFVDADGRQILPGLDANVAVRVQPNVSSSSVQLVLAIPQLVLPRFGEYAIDLAVDGRVEK